MTPVVVVFSYDDIRDRRSHDASSAGQRAPGGERADILETLLATHRDFLRHTVHGLTDEQARLRPTASELTLGGLIKHVARPRPGGRPSREGPTAIA